MNRSTVSLVLACTLSVGLGVAGMIALGDRAYADGAASVPLDAGPALVTSDIAVVTTTTTTASSPPVATAPEPSPSAPDVVASIVQDARGGHWRYAAAGALALLMLALGKARDRATWFRGDRGGAVLVLVLSLAGALSTVLASGAPLGFDVLLGAIGTAFTAAGGYTVVRRLLWPRAA